ncbi:MAG: His/Gly/Thr/Pro-type tRNA ligase C-terminal domain-containing protein [Patescibacteria group bacterium]
MPRATLRVSFASPASVKTNGQKERNDVTIRDRDTGKQERVKIEEIKTCLKEKLA